MSVPGEFTQVVAFRMVARGRTGSYSPGIPATSERVTRTTTDLHKRLWNLCESAYILPGLGGTAAELAAVALYIGVTLTLKQRLTEVLEAAGFTGREDHLPIYSRGGTFSIRVLIGVEVRVAWWDSSEWERRELLERFAVALEAAGITVEDRGEALYVAAELRAAAREKERGRRRDPSDSRSAWYHGPGTSSNPQATALLPLREATRP